MKKIFTLLLFIFFGNADASSVDTLIPARGYVKRMVMDAQNAFGITKDQQAQVYVISDEKKHNFTGFAAIVDGKKQIQISPNLSYEGLKFVALHEAAHIAHEHTKQQDHLETSKKNDLRKKTLLMIAPILGLSMYKSWLYALGLLPINNIYCGEQEDIRHAISILRCNQEREADIEAVIHLKCKQCVEGAIENCRPKNLSGSTLSGGYLTSQDMRAFSAQYHTDTPCRYHGSSLVRKQYEKMALAATGLKNIPK